MDAEDEERKRRAAARANWPIRKLSLAQEGQEDLSALTPGERFALVWRLTQDAWALKGEPMPSYKRSETPIRIIRRAGKAVAESGSPEPDDRKE